MVVISLLQLNQTFRPAATLALLLVGPAQLADLVLVPLAFVLGRVVVGPAGLARGAVAGDGGADRQHRGLDAQGGPEGLHDDRADAYALAVAEDPVAWYDRRGEW